MVFASETLRFYFACGGYSDFLHHCVRYLLSFLQKHYPLHLLISGFLSVWRSGRHAFTKYKNSPTIWHEDILHRIPPHYSQPRRQLTTPTPVTNASQLSLYTRARTPTPAYLRYPITYGTSIPGFASGGCTHSKPTRGGFSLAPKRPSATSLHNTRMAKRRRLNAHYNRRYGTNTYLSSDSWSLRHSYMAQSKMWLRDQIFNGNGNSICW